MAKPKNQDLKALYKKWNKKLKDDGFVDIESDPDHLGFYTSQFAAQFVDREAGTWEAKAEYYRLAEHFLHEHKFRSELEKVIWEYHSNALSYRDISKILKKLNLVEKCNRTKIYDIVTNLRDIMFKLYNVSTK